MVDIPRHMVNTLSKDYKWMLKKPFFHYEAMMELMEGNYATGSYISPPVISSVNSIDGSNEAIEVAIPNITVVSPGISLAIPSLPSPTVGTPLTTTYARSSPVMISPFDVTGISSPSRTSEFSAFTVTSTAANSTSAGTVFAPVNALVNPSSKSNGSKKRPHYKREDDKNAKKNLTVQDVYASLIAAADNDKYGSAHSKNTEVLAVLQAKYAALGMVTVMSYYKQIVKSNEQELFLPLAQSKELMDVYLGIQTTVISSDVDASVSDEESH
jgi:hypothetical protein